MAATKTKSPFPKTISPMLATLVESVPENKEWVYEIKWDGYRCIALCHDGKVELVSRNNKSFNEKYYPIYQALKKHNLNAIFDGELVVLNDDGITTFEGMQNWRSEADGELIYYIFDILWLNGIDLMPLPLSERKKILRKALPKSPMIRESESLSTKPAEFMKAAKKMGLEGMIAKRADSPYKEGDRGHDWLKIKAAKRHEVVIGGYTKNEDTPKPFSALLVGVYEGGKLEYTGKIGTGFDTKTQKILMEKFKNLETSKCPFADEPDYNKPTRFNPAPLHATVTWVKPKIVCEVNYTEMTSDGVMRHPSFKGIREDKSSKDVHPEVVENISTRSKKISLNLAPVAKGDRKTLLNPSEETQVKLIKGHELKFTNLSKVFWPEKLYTKRDLINYYYQVATYILPYLRNRPQSLNRFPNGISAESFYQKDVTKTAPPWMKQYPYHTSLGEDKNYLIVQDEADLLWMANMGAIEMNPWNSTIEYPDHPTWCLIDIDPTEKNSFDQVVETALATKHVLDELKIEGYCKTSGADGLHIYIPLGAKYTYEQCQLFARMIATHVNALLPKFTSIERFTDKRKGKIYVDFLQNRPKATLAAPYSLRPKPDATISMPLHWSEVKKGLKPQKFTLANALERIKAEGDIFKPVIGKGINLAKALKNL